MGSSNDHGYDQLESLTSSTSSEISRLSVIVKNLRLRVESLEKKQTELMDKINELQRMQDTDDDVDD